MGWVIFVAGAALSWGAYGVFLQQGQAAQLGNPLKAAINPMLYLDFLLAAVGAAMVLYFRPAA